MNAIASSVSYIVIQSASNTLSPSGLIVPALTGFSYGAISSATITRFNLDTLRSQSGTAALVAALSSISSDIIDAINGGSFRIQSTLLRASSAAVIAALTQPAAAASLLGGRQGSSFTPITTELLEQAAEGSRIFGILQSLVAGGYATPLNLWAEQS